MATEERRAYNRAQYRFKRADYIARAKKSYERNKDARLKYIRDWQAANREKRKATTRKYRDAHPQECRAAVIAWEVNNPGKKKAINKDWSTRNAEHIKKRRAQYRQQPHNRAREKARKATWTAANIEKARMQGRRDANARRARLALAHGSFTVQQAIWRIEFYGWRCVYCLTALNEETVTLDHKIPISRGGSDWPSNLVPACKSCNSKKHRRTFTEYMALLLSTL